MTGVSKVEPAAGHPPEDGCYLKGNDYSPLVLMLVNICIEVGYGFVPLLA